MVLKRPAISESDFQIQNGPPNPSLGQNSGISEEPYEHSHSLHGDGSNADAGGESSKSSSNLPSSNPTPFDFDSSAQTMTGDQWGHQGQYSPAQNQGQSNGTVWNGTNTASGQDGHSYDSSAVQDQDNGSSSNPYQFHSNNPFVHTPKKSDDLSSTPADNRYPLPSYGTDSADYQSNNPPKYSLYNDQPTQPASLSANPTGDQTQTQPGALSPQNTGPSIFDGLFAPPDISNLELSQPSAGEQRPGIPKKKSLDLIDLGESNNPLTQGESQFSTNSASVGDTRTAGSDTFQGVNQHKADPITSADQTTTGLPTVELTPPSGNEASASNSQPHQEEVAHSETYDIRTINWTDGTTELRHSPILVQNENGPCPLLALVNALIMRSAPDAQTPLVRALKTRETISLGLLIQALFDELMTYNDQQGPLPDIEALSSFLTMLHTGMNVNPRLTPEVDSPTPGMFLKTQDIHFYSAFKLPLVHGWIAPPTSPAHASMLRVAEYHEDIQLLHFRKEELENRVVNGNILTPDEEQVIQDIDNIQRFVDVENATQLSSYGLELLIETLEPGAICILFRNDHFSTLFKHPLSGQLFTLVTDAGYASHAEIVWESLVDINGTFAEFFSGDFRPVGHAPGPPASAETNNASPGQENNEDSQSQSHTEQTDADYAFALALQFEDEEQQRRREREREREQSQNTQQQNGTQQSGRRVSSSVSSRTTPRPPPGRHNRPASVTVPTRGASQPTGRRTSTRQDVRPLVPPTNRPTDPDAEAPPPPYEQAARAPAYNPTDTHPRQRSTPRPVRPYDGDDRSGPRALVNYGYSSPLNDHSDRRRTIDSSHSTALPARPREKDRNKDCIVM